MVEKGVVCSRTTVDSRTNASSVAKLDISSKTVLKETNLQKTMLCLLLVNSTVTTGLSTAELRRT